MYNFTNLRWTVLCACFGIAPVVSAATLQVGPGKTYTTICSAAAAASDGDTIEISAGTYKGDVCVISKNSLTLKGIGGRPKLDAGGVSAQGKGIWVINGHDTVVNNIEFTNAKVADHNGAGIRLPGEESHGSELLVS